MVNINIFIEKKGLIFLSLVKHVCPVLHLSVFQWPEVVSPGLNFEAFHCNGDVFI